MSRSILILGESGAGKSSSMKNLDPKETFIIQVEEKDLPFRSSGYSLGEKGKPPEKANIVQTDNFTTIYKTMEYVSENRPEIKTLIIDDFQYLMANQFMRTISDKGFDKFNNIALITWKTAKLAKALRSDLTVFMLSHVQEEESSTGGSIIRAKTLGKLIDRVITLEGMFTTVLLARPKQTKDGIKFRFITQNDGTTTVKSPIDMFDANVNGGDIDNDLQLVKDTFSEYYI